MENGRKLLRGIALAAIAVIGLGGIALFASPSLAAQTRPDVIRIDAIGQLKKLEKDKAISEDELKKATDDVQKLTDKYVAKVDEKCAAKEKEIMDL
jgi:hypothetical protein